ncbi:bactofilin family protein [Cognatilysobacter lacus]|uniref:Polymer-forming cytoskeletal protein n=1 Tax=Cognatilysobacter lacus TaxID=1643323 RepID=A0A5D8Z4Z3_9GAMM|nr:polymer-forming cytoskeletal protein [Lysobacter lacus]TZF87764.1 polymer-forming cytoskeletal protein [Lysobacter lacus]
MAIFPNTSNKRDGAPMPESALGKDASPNEFAFAPPTNAPAPSAIAPVAPAARPATREAKESVIASDVSIEGRIQGAGNVRIAGRFTGDIAVEGDLTIEVGARVNGGIKARRVVIAGELEGNVESAQRVEVVETGSLVGDIKAGAVTVAPGARMRGMVEFGWGDSGNGAVTGGKSKGDTTPEAGSAA